jgi:hypothetical protein
LPDVCKLVREQPVARTRSRRIAARSECDVIADGIRARRNVARGLGRLRVGVDTNPREVVLEAALQYGAHAGLERPPG